MERLKLEQKAPGLCNDDCFSRYPLLRTLTNFALNPSRELMAGFLRFERGF